ncbi:MAG: tetratricopeptide repeat protein [Fuerstiella sp.]|nr:tetratricopeptide repeat protein [Fuerstiella sp.]
MLLGNPRLRKPSSCAILLLLSCISAVRGQTTQSDSRVGQKFIVTNAGAELRTPQATVWRAYPGEVFDVSLVNGEWLWIQSKGGWLWENDGIFFQKAISVASDRVAKTPTAEAYHIRGVVFIAHKRYERALMDFTSSLQKSPQNAGVLNNRGQCHYLLGNYPAAIVDFSSAIKNDSTHFVAFNNRALVHIAMEQYSDARIDIRQALLLNPRYPEALLNRGVVNQKSGHPQQAIADYTAAISIDSTYAAAYNNRAFSYRRLGQYQKAINDLHKSMEFDPESFEPINDLAFTLATAKDNNIRDALRALSLAEKANSMSEQEHWNMLDTLAVARAAVNDFDGAARAMARAIELAPENEQTQLKSHQALIAAGKPVRQ